MTSQSFCGACGERLDEPAQFCPACGVDQRQFAVSPDPDVTEVLAASADLRGPEERPLVEDNEPTLVRDLPPPEDDVALSAALDPVAEAGAEVSPAPDPVAEAGAEVSPAPDPVAEADAQAPPASDPLPDGNAHVSPETHRPPAGNTGAAFCGSCGSKFAPGNRFCERCGAPRSVPEASTEPEVSPISHAAVLPRPAPVGPPTPGPLAVGAAPFRPSLFEAVPPLPGRLGAVPLELLVVCALTAVAGALTLWPAVAIFPDIVELLGGGGPFLDLGLLLLTVWVMLALVGCGCLVLAWRLFLGDRVARGVAYVLVGGLAVALLFADQRESELTIVMLACFGSVAVLALSPRVHEFFAGGEDDEPTSVVVARTLLAIWAGCAVLIGAMFLPIGGLGEEYVIAGVVLLVIAAGAFALNRRLGEGDPQARVLVSIGAVIWVVLALVVGRSDPGLLVPVALGVGITANLWIPRDAQRHFATA